MGRIKCQHISRRKQPSTTKKKGRGWECKIKNKTVQQPKKMFIHIYFVEELCQLLLTLL